MIKAERSFDGIVLDRPGGEASRTISLQKFQLCPGCFARESGATPAKVGGGGVCWWVGGWSGAGGIGVLARGSLPMVGGGLRWRGSVRCDGALHIAALPHPPPPQPHHHPCPPHHMPTLASASPPLPGCLQPRGLPTASQFHSQFPPSPGACSRAGCPPASRCPTCGRWRATPSPPRQTPCRSWRTSSSTRARCVCVCVCGGTHHTLSM